jgi:Domain of unknown function (DU1801)
MADGVVTTDGTVFEAMLAGFPEGIQQLAHDARALIYDVLPGTVEVVWPHQRSAGYGTGPRKMTEHFCWLAPQTRHVVFGFYYGTELPDPTGLLEGTGRLMRHAKIRSATDLANPALRQLVQIATTHRVPALGSG